MEFEQAIQRGRFGYLKKVLEELAVEAPRDYDQVLTYLKFGQPEGVLDQLRHHDVVLIRSSRALQYLPSSLVRPGVGDGGLRVPGDLLLRIGRFLDVVLPPPEEEVLPRSVAWMIKVLPLESLWADEIETALNLCGQPPHLHVERLLTIESEFQDSVGQSLLGSKGFDEALRRHADVVQRCLTEARYQTRSWTLDVLHRLEVEPSPWCDAITAASVSASKIERRAAEPLVSILGVKATPKLVGYLRARRASTRIRAAELLSTMGGDGVRRSIEEQRRRDPSAKAREAMGMALGALGKDVSGELEILGVGLEPLGEEWTQVVPLTEEARRCFRGIFRPNIDPSREQRLSNPWVLGTVLPKVSSEEIEAALAAIEQPEPWDALFPPILGADFRSYLQPLEDSLLQPFLHASGTRWIHRVRCLAVFGFVPESDHLFATESLVRALSLNESQDVERLRGLAEACKSIRVDPALLGRLHMERRKLEPIFEWGEATWRYLRQYPEAIDEALDLRRSPQGWNTREDHHRHERRLQALELMANMPALPRRWLEALWEVVLSGREREVKAARQILERHDLDVDRILGALTHHAVGHRRTAAAWLGDLALHSGACSKVAGTALGEAFERESDGATRRALQDALAHLGVLSEDDEKLSPSGLLQEAREGLAKRLPKTIRNFPLEDLPSLCWSDAVGKDAGETVPLEVVRWLSILAIQGKEARPSHSLAKRVELLDTATAADLGAYLLRTWMAHDINVEPFSDDVKQRMREELELDFESPGLWERLREEHARSPRGTSMPLKGLLGLVALTANGEVAHEVQDYLAQWYGYRYAQCLVLLETLAQIDDSAAHRVLQFAAQSVKTKSIRKAAGKLVESIAVAKGCTVEQLIANLE